MSISDAEILFYGVETELGEPIISALRRLQVSARARYCFSAQEAAEALDSLSPDILIATTDEYQADQSLPPFLHRATAATAVLASKSHPHLPKEAQLVSELSAESAARACVVLLNLNAQAASLKQLESENLALNSALSELRQSTNLADAIAVDGMIVSCSPAFAEHFGYDSEAALECMPLLDIVDSEDRVHMRSALASHQRDPLQATVELNMTHRVSGAMPVSLNLEHVDFNDEQAVRLVVSMAASSEGEAQKPSQPSAWDSVSSKEAEPSGVYVQRIKHYLESEHSPSSLLYVGVDQFDKLISSQGLIGGASLMRSFSETLRELLPEAKLGRICDEAIAALLPSVPTSDALVTAEQLCKTLAECQFDVNGEARAVTASIGVVALDSSYGIDPWAIFDQARVACNEVRKTNGKTGIGNGAAIFARVAKRVESAVDDDTANINSEVEAFLQAGKPKLTWQPVVSMAGSPTGAIYQVDLVDEEFASCGAKWLSRVESETQETHFDRWLIKTAIEAVGQMADAENPIRLLIDVSSNVARDSGFLRWLGVVLTASKLSSDNLVLMFRSATAANCLADVRQFLRTAKNEGLEGLAVGLRDYAGTAVELQLLAEFTPALIRVSERFLEQSLSATGSYAELEAAVAAIKTREQEALTECDGDNDERLIPECDTKLIMPGIDSAALMTKLCQLHPDFILGQYIQPPTLDMNYQFEEL